MQIGNTRNGDAGDVVGGRARRAFGDRSDIPVGDRDADIAGPAGGQQRVIEKQLASQIRFSAGFAHVLIGKPVPTFPEHALDAA
jgi:hypothetical protein